MNPGLHADRRHQRLRIVRFAVILALLCVGWGTLKTGATNLPYFIWKMSPAEVEARLRKQTHGPYSDPRIDLRCVDGKPYWDYICSYTPKPAFSPERRKVGVRVFGGQISFVSPSHAADDPHIRP